MHLPLLASALLLTSLVLASTQVPIHARDAFLDSDLSARGEPDLNARDAYSETHILRRAPVYTHQQVQEGQDHIKAQTLTYKEEAAHLDTMHANGASHAELSQHHSMLAGLAHE
jgi:hypothetical protein